MGSVYGNEGSEGPANPCVYEACPLPSRLASHFSRYLSKSSANSLPSSFHQQSDYAMPLANFDVIEIINLTSPCQPTLTSNFASRYWTSVTVVTITTKTTNPFLPLREYYAISRKHKTTCNYLGASLAIETGPADSVFDILNSSDYIDAPLLEPPRDGDTGGGVDSCNSIHPPPLLPLPLPGDTAPSSISDTQTESTGDALKDFGYGPSSKSNGRKKKVDIGRAQRR